MNESGSLCTLRAFADEDLVLVREAESATDQIGPAMSVRTPSFASKAGWNALASLVSGLNGALCGIVVARILGPSGTGEVAYTIWLTTTTAAVAGFGLPQTMVRFLAEAQGRGVGDPVGLGRWILRRWLVFVGAGVGLTVGTMLLLPGQRHDPRHLVATGLLAALQMMAIAYQSLEIGLQRFSRLARLNLMAALVQLTGVLVGALVAGSDGVLAGYAGGASVLGLRALTFIKKTGVLCPDPHLRRRIRSYAFYSWSAIMVSLFSWSRLEIFFLDLYWGKQSVALFSVSMSLAQLATQGPLLLGGALLPHFSQMVGRGQTEAVKRTYGSLTSLFALMVFPLCLVLAALTPALVPCLFGRSFDGAASSAAVVVVFASLGAVAAVGSSYLYAMERSRFIAKSGVVFAGITVVAYWVGIPRWGVSGAAWLRSLIQGAAIATGTIYISTVLRTAFPLRRVARTVFAAFLAALPARMIANAWPDFRGALLGSLLAALVYVTLIRWMKLVAEAELVKLEETLSAAPLPFKGLARGILGWIRG